jgi:hypothetical protein
MVNLLDESGLQKLVNLLTDDLALSSLKRRKRFFTGLEPARISKACSVTSLGMPGISEGLHVNMSAFARRKSTSTTSYLGFEGGADFQCLPIRAGRVEGHELDVFCGLKAADVVLGVGDLLGQTVKVCSQGR